MDLISITDARRNLSRLVAGVFAGKKRYVLIRDSKPQVVMLSYQDYLAIEGNWQEEMRKLMDKGRIKSIKKEEDAYKLVDKMSGRN